MVSDQSTVNEEDATGASLAPAGMATDHSPPVTTARICCGPRCGAEPGHRLIYAAVERAATDAGLLATPTMCRSVCSGGVTVILPDGTVKKVSDVSAAKTVLDKR
ncbi:MAG: hypothetical protein H8F28_25645 [Fibrella sp.]|nr:hypothetical protein [Armatimonadota bacterium]